MTGPWQLLRSLLAEAKSAADYKKDLLKLITRRFGEHEAGEVEQSLRSMPFKDWRQQMAYKYMSDEIDKIIKDMAGAALAAHRAKQGGGERPGAKVPPTSGAAQAPSGRQYISPDVMRDKQAGIDAMRAARQGSGSGGQDAAKALMTPGSGGAHAVGTAGQNQPKPQPSVAAGVAPQQQVPGRSKSGLVQAQRDVDRETRSKGAKAGEQLAAQLGVPTTAERTSVDDEGKERVHVWSPDRVMKFMDPDQNPGRGMRSDADRRAQAAQLGKSAATGAIDPDRLEKIKQGILKRNAAPTKLGPNRPGSFPGERWKPHGRETDVLRSRPDKATGNWIRGKQALDPKHTGQEVVWDGEKWVLPSVWAAKAGERSGQDSGDEDDEYPASQGWRRAQ